MGAVAAAIGIALAVSRPPVPFGPPGDLTGEAGDICEAVLRYQFDDTEISAPRRNAKAFFITISGHRRLGAFLDRFRDETVPVLDGQWAWRTGGRKFFHVDALAFDSPSRVRAHGSCYEGPKSAYGCTYGLRRVSGRWTVIGYELDWIE